MLEKLDAEKLEAELGKLRNPEVAYLAKDQLGRSALHVPCATAFPITLFPGDAIAVFHIYYLWKRPGINTPLHHLQYQAQLFKEARAADCTFVSSLVLIGQRSAPSSGKKLCTCGRSRCWPRRRPW